MCTQLAVVFGRAALDLRKIGQELSHHSHGLVLCGAEVTLSAVDFEGPSVEALRKSRLFMSCSGKPSAAAKIEKKVRCDSYCMYAGTGRTSIYIQKAYRLASLAYLHGVFWYSPPARPC